MAFFDSMKVSASGMTAQRLRMDTISQNIANVNTTRTENGEPYRRKKVVFEEMDRNGFQNLLNSKIGDTKLRAFQQNGGVKVSKIIEDDTEFAKVYNPSHPDADKEGYVSMPNVNVVEEMTNLISANRSYEANITAFNATKSMAQRSLQIGS